MANWTVDDVLKDLLEVEFDVAKQQILNDLLAMSKGVEFAHKVDGDYEGDAVPVADIKKYFGKEQ